jgi:hypothetical protein
MKAKVSTIKDHTVKLHMIMIHLVKANTAKAFQIHKVDKQKKFLLPTGMSLSLDTR